MASSYPNQISIVTIAAGETRRRGGADVPYDSITLYRYTDGSTGSLDKRINKGRAIILEDVQGKTVTIGLGASPTKFDDLLLKAQKVLDSVKWTAS
jgi:hypothetical protein